MNASIIIRTRNEAPRLRLVLASFERQEGLTEIVVTDDGSTDGTAGLLSDEVGRLPLRIIRHQAALGRAAASNAAAAAATGDLLIFFDGDTLASPGLIAAHLQTHLAHPFCIARGETWHLRCTRFLLDPESGVVQPTEVSRFDRMSLEERDGMRITRAQVMHDFAAIERRATPGIYPGTSPRRLHDLEMTALRAAPHSQSLWAAASGSNTSVMRETFLKIGGLDPQIDINEHRELAYRLSRTGFGVVPVEGARSYHLTHRSGWRDPLADDAWERRFRAIHPEAPLDRLKEYWKAIAQQTSIPDFFA